MVRASVIKTEPFLQSASEPHLLLGLRAAFPARLNCIASATPVPLCHCQFCPFVSPFPLFTISACLQ